MQKMFSTLDIQYAVTVTYIKPLKCLIQMLKRIKGVCCFTDLVGLCRRTVVQPHSKCDSRRRLLLERFPHQPWDALPPSHFILGRAGVICVHSATYSFTLQKGSNAWKTLNYIIWGFILLPLCMFFLSCSGLGECGLVALVSPLPPSSVCLMLSDWREVLGDGSILLPVGLST